MKFSMDTGGPGIDLYTEVIPPYMVLTYVSYDDSNRKSDRDIDYETEDNDDDVLGAKELLGGTSIYYTLTEANIHFLLRYWDKLHMTVLWSKISICDVVQNVWLSINHVIDGYDEETEKAMSEYDIHKTKMKLYYISKALRHRINSDLPTLYNTPDKLDWRGCCIATVKDTKANINYEANNVDAVMG